MKTSVSLMSQVALDGQQHGVLGLQGMGVGVACVSQANQCDTSHTAKFPQYFSCI